MPVGSGNSPYEFLHLGPDIRPVESDGYRKAIEPGHPGVAVRKADEEFAEQFVSGIAQRKTVNFFFAPEGRAFLEQRNQKSFLVWEVPVERSLAHPCRGRDLVHSGAVIAAF